MGACRICGIKNPIVKGQSYCVYCYRYAQDNQASWEMTKAVRKKRPKMTTMTGQMFISQQKHREILTAARNDAQRCTELALATIEDSASTMDDVKIVLEKKKATEDELTAKLSAVALEEPPEEEPPSEEPIRDVKK